MCLYKIVFFHVSNFTYNDITSLNVQLDIYFIYITKQLPVIMHCLLAYHAMAQSQKLRYPKKNFSEGEKNVRRIKKKASF